MNNKYIIGVPDKKLADEFNFGMWVLHPDVRKVGLPKGSIMLSNNFERYLAKKTLGVLKYRGKQAFVNALEEMVKRTEG